MWMNSTVKIFQDSVWNYVFGISASESSHSDLAGKVTLSGDTMVTILCMVSSNFITLVVFNCCKTVNSFHHCYFIIFRCCKSVYNLSS